MTSVATKLGRKGRWIMEANRQHRRAFTLVELLVVIAIIALLIILLGEKKSDYQDFYMEFKQDGSTDFWRLVEQYRHGIQLGSNYLMLDGHIESKAPKEAEGGLDPWDIPATQPANPPPGP